MTERSYGTVVLIDSNAPPKWPQPQPLEPLRQRLKGFARDSGGDLVGMLASFANELGVQCELDRRLAELRAVIEKRLASSPAGCGALVSVEYYVHSEGQVVLGPVRLLGFGADPNSVHKQSVDAPGMSSAPPDHLLHDRRRDQFLWYTGSPMLRTDVVIHPFTELLRKGKLVHK